MTSPILSTGCTRGLYLYPSSRRLAPNLYCFVIQLYKQDSPPPQNALSQFLCYSIAVLPYRKCPFLHAIRFHALTSTVSRQILNEAIHQFRLANGVAPCPPSWPGATRPAAPPRPAASPPTWAHKKRPPKKPEQLLLRGRFALLFPIFCAGCSSMFILQQPFLISASFAMILFVLAAAMISTDMILAVVMVAGGLGSAG